MVKRLFILAAAILALSACGGRGKSLLPNVSGKAGEVVAVIDKDSWEGAVGGALRDALAGDCPYLAQREPLFALTNVPPGSFTNMFKVHRNLVLINIDPHVPSPGVFYKYDQWAHPQAVVQVSAADRDAALALVMNDGAKMAEFFEQAERNRIIANAKLYEELSVAEAVRKVTGGGALHCPTGYKIKRLTDNFLWAADERQYTNQAILVYRYPAEGDVFTKEAIIAKRNEILGANIPGMFENTYMTTSEGIEPTVRSLSYKGIDFMETRGFWEVHNDYMGGPFVSHSFYSKDGSEIIVLEAFVYAPRFDKRQYFRQVESLIWSFEWEDEKS